METSLHRQLKAHYAAGRNAECEVRYGRYRIDVVADDELIEIQHGSLAAIRRKIEELVVERRVRVVKPIVLTKRLVKLRRRGGAEIGRRLSPKRGAPLDLFHELVYFVPLFPHPNLTIDAPLVEIEERRYPGHGRRRRRRSADHQIEDQLLIALHGGLRLSTARDLMALIQNESKTPMPTIFHTGHLAESLSVARWVAQRIAYCLRESKAVCDRGKLGNARLYSFSEEAVQQSASNDRPARRRRRA